MKEDASLGHWKPSMPQEQFLYRLHSLLEAVSLALKAEPPEWIHFRRPGKPADRKWEILVEEARRIVDASSVKPLRGRALEKVARAVLQLAGNDAEDLRDLLRRVRRRTEEEWTEIRVDY